MDDRSKNTTTSSHIKQGTMTKFMQSIKANLFIKTFKDGVKSIGNSGSYRSAYYICPANFYNHGSKTFKRNQRKGL